MSAQQQASIESDLVFAPEDDGKIPSPKSSDDCWKVLIIDNEPDIHEVTR